MSRPTHRVKATGVKVFADGYPAAAIEPLTDEAWTEHVRARSWAGVRARRDVLLAESDWTQLPDAPEPTAAAWRDYRQALRDLPEQGDDPDAVTWPAPPA